MTRTYEVRGSHCLQSSSGHASFADAVAAVRKQRSGLVATTWYDGTVSFYLSHEDAMRDDTGEHAIGVVVRSDDADR